MNFLWFGLGLFVGFVLSSAALDRYYAEQNVLKMKHFALELMREFAKATREIEEAKSKVQNSQLN